MKRPGVLSLARICELFLVSCFMILIAERLRRRPALFRIAADAYTAAAVLGAAASIAGWLLFHVASVPNPLVFGAEARARGLFTEGGPYGIFLVSAIAVAALRLHAARPRCPALSKAAMATIAAALPLSGSKTGVLAAIGLCAIAALFSGGTAIAQLWLFILAPLLGGAIAGMVNAAGVTRAD